MMSTLEVGMFA